MIRVERVRQEVKWAPNLLFIDVDPGQILYPKRHMATLLKRAGYSMLGRWVGRSRSKGGRHVIVTLDRATSGLMETVALQSILGSDRYREACNASRARLIASAKAPLAKYWQDRWNVLYEPKFNPTRRKDGQGK